MPAARKLLVVDVAALGWELVKRHPAAEARFTFRPAETVFPAVTCPVQAAFRTGRPPSECGLESNGFFLRELRKVAFWEPSAELVRGDRFWRAARERGKKIGLLFWQQSLGEQADLILSPKPIHQHHGGMIQDCYSQPHDLYARLCTAVGRPFELRHYWGPLASRRATDWIVDATCAVLQAPDLAPDLLLTYLPHLDYDLQRHGPAGRPAARALAQLHAALARLGNAAAAAGYDVLVFGDYAIAPVAGGPVYPNRALRAAGLFQVRTVQGRDYPDFYTSAVFAMCDHQAAPVCVLDAARRPAARALLAGLTGVGAVYDRGGDLLLAAQPGHWFAYPWWTKPGAAPDYAGHVDIHNKPGYDPGELFWGWPPGRISQDAARVRGTHGLAGPGREIAWAASWPVDAQPRTLLDLAQLARNRLEAP